MSGDSPLYGGNAVYLEELYDAYRSSPESLDQRWRDFFADFRGESGKKARTHLRVIGVKDEESAGASKPNLKGEKISAPQDVAGLEQACRDSVNALMLIRAYKVRGHLLADLDPLALTGAAEHPDLNPATYGFGEGDYDRSIFMAGALGLKHATLRELVGILRRDYSSCIGVEFMHIPSLEQREWIAARMEDMRRFSLTKEDQHSILRDLVHLQEFEQFLHKKFPGQKRFSIEGGESALTAMEKVIEASAGLGVKEVLIGMAHRGRLNVLTNVMAKPHRAVFHEFKGGSYAPDDVEGSGDVKYHLGASSDREFDGNKVHLSLTANPSHLEIVDPVVMGKARAKQDQLAGRTREEIVPLEQRAKVLPLLLHGDAAFAGQGVVAECLGLSGLKGHRVAGTLHFIINNQIGFTTNPRFSRSSPYPSDVAKMIEAPIFHVNGDDPEAVVYAAKVATEFRMKFHKPVVVDMFCYRRFGHNEGDEPSFTQPKMYKVIRAHKTVVQIYGERLIAEGLISEGDLEKMRADWRARLEQEFEAGQSYKPNKADWLDGAWSGLRAADNQDEQRRGKTSVPMKTLKEIGRKLSEVPADFKAHKTIQRFMENRANMIETGQGIDWAMGEALAF
ncbi:MAG: thiamine pyrophosphate-dependent enzyme, partial [Rickettsiales bacterium]